MLSEIGQDHNFIFDFLGSPWAIYLPRNRKADKDLFVGDPISNSQAEIEGAFKELDEFRCLAVPCEGLVNKGHEVGRCLDDFAKKVHLRVISISLSDEVAGHHPRRHLVRTTRRAEVILGIEGRFLKRQNILRQNK